MLGLQSRQRLPEVTYKVIEVKYSLNVSELIVVN